MKTLLLTCLLTLPVMATVNVVTDCGLVGNGTTDNLAAFRSCVAANPTATFFFPSGNTTPARYFFSGTTHLNRQQSLRSDNTSTVLVGPSSSSVLLPLFVFSDGNGTLYPNTDILDSITVACGGKINMIGVYLGGDPGNTFSPATDHGDQTNIVDSRITGCGQAVRWGNNTWGTNITRSSIFGNIDGLMVVGPLSNSGELIVVRDSHIFNNSGHPFDSANQAWEWVFEGTRVDNNGLPGTFLGGGSVTIGDEHAEGGSAPYLLGTGGNMRLAVKNSTFLVNPTNENLVSFIQVNGGNTHLDLDNDNFFSNSPMSEVVNITGNFFDQISNIQANPGNIHKLLSTDPTTIAIWQTPYAAENNHGSTSN